MTQELTIRWLSLYYMVKQFIKCKERVTLWLLRGSCTKIITRDDWTKMENIVTLLEPLEDTFKV